MLFVIFKRLLCIFFNSICWKTTLHENCLNPAKDHRFLLLSAALGPLLAASDLSWASPGPLLADLGPLLAALESLLARLGPLLARLGPLLARLGPLLGRSRAGLGAVLGALGAVLAALGGLLGALGGTLGHQNRFSSGLGCKNRIFKKH